MTATESPWPQLVYADWADTCTTLHLWTQIVGKIRLVQNAWVNHSWHVTLYVTPRGLTTSPIPWGSEQFQIDFDFIDHRLMVATSIGTTKEMSLAPMSVAAFHRRLFALLGELGIDVHINPLPNEVPEPIPFHADEQHASYDADAVHRFWRVLLQCDRVFKAFRARFTGKCSPVHFFWGSNDLAVTRFSGRTAPAHPGGVPNLPDPVTREAYNQEVSSAGFWPGGGPLDHAAFYSYAYPVPGGFAEQRVAPDAAYFDANLGEFLLPYDAVRIAADPDGLLLDFLQSTYDAAAETAGWDRGQLERNPVRPR